MTDTVTNVVVAGIGGQGVLKCSDMLAEAAFRSGLDVKKAEVHGMSQRGGSVTSDVRFGETVESPMVPAGEADFLLVLSAEEIENNRRHLREGGTLITPEDIDSDALPNARCLNVAMLGAVSRHTRIDERHFLEAIRANLPERLHEMNLKAFEIGRG